MKYYKKSPGIQSNKKVNIFIPDVLDKVASLSSVFGSEYSGLKAVDGIYLPSDFGVHEIVSLAHTNLELSPWIQVDLITNHFVDGVKIWDRSEGHNQSELIR